MNPWLIPWIVTGKLLPLVGFPFEDLSSRPQNWMQRKTISSVPKIYNFLVFVFEYTQSKIHFSTTYNFLDIDGTSAQRDSELIN